MFLSLSFTAKNNCLQVFYLLVGFMNIKLYEQTQNTMPLLNEPKWFQPKEKNKPAIWPLLKSEDVKW